jgi:hypothetical protein
MHPISVRFLMPTHLHLPRLDDPQHGRWLSPVVAIVGFAVFLILLIGLFRAAL